MRVTSLSEYFCASSFAVQGGERGSDASEINRI